MAGFPRLVGTGQCAELPVARRPRMLWAFALPGIQPPPRCLMASRCCRMLLLPALLAGALSWLAPVPAAAASAPRLVLRLLPGVEPGGLVPYGAAGGLATPAPLILPGALRLESLLRAAGAGPAARLSDDLVDAPPSWRRTFVVTLPEGTTPGTARDLAARIVGERLAEFAEPAAAVYEPLVVKGFDWGRGATDPPARSSAFLAPQAALRDGLFPNDPLFADGTQWGLYNTGLGLFGGATGVDVRAPEAWARFAGSTATILGVVDTGIDPAHPELNTTLFDGTPRLVATLSATDPPASPADSSGHGTMVAGVMAAITNNGPQLDGRGVAGMAGGTGGDSTGVRLVAVKATGNRTGDATGPDLARAIVFAHQYGARAINVSFGGDERTGLVRDACQWVTERGSAVIFGAGNSGAAAPQYPGWYATLGVGVSVGALDPFGERALFSTYGDQVDVVAPGQEIYSTWLTYANAYGSSLRNFAQTSGTSFSAPFVTGMAGLAYGLQPDLAGNDFQQLVRRTARDWGEPGRDEFFGSGFADAFALVEKLAPPWGVAHGSAPAESWASAGMESLRVFDSGITRGGYSVDGDYYAERYVVSAAAVLADPALDVPQVWVRPSGPGGWSAGREHEANIPWGDVVSGSEALTGAELLTNVYYIDVPPPACPSCAPIGWLPRPPEEVVMEWSAWARYDAPPTLRVIQPAPGAVWTAGQRYAVEWEASDPDTVTVVTVYWRPEGAASQLLGESGAAVGSLTVTAPCRPAAGGGVIEVIACDAHGVVECVREDVPVGIVGSTCGPGSSVALRLAPPFPNPARSSVNFTAWWDPPVPAGTDEAGMVSLPVRFEIYDLRGAMVRRLPADAGTQTGTFQATWDGVTDDGATAPSGAYVVRVDDGTRSATRRFVWLR